LAYPRQEGCNLSSKTGLSYLFLSVFFGIVFDLSHLISSFLTFPWLTYIILVSELRLPSWPSFHPNTFPKHKPQNCVSSPALGRILTRPTRAKRHDGATAFPAHSHLLTALWHGLPMLKGTTVPPPFQPILVLLFHKAHTSCLLAIHPSKWPNKP